MSARRIAVAVPTVAVLTFSLVACSDDGAVVPGCPPLGPTRQAGTLGQAPGDPAPATVGISGLAVSRFDSGPEGEQIAWAVGDRSANEIAGPNQVFLFGLDARDGSLAIRYPLNPGDLQDDPVDPTTDTVTRVGQTPNPIPDLEELSIEYVAQGPGRLWLFDTGDNGDSRANLNAYVVREPDLATSVGGGPSFLASHPELDGGLTGPTLSVTRHPIRLMRDGVQVTSNIEAAFVDANAPGDGPAPVYLIAKSPVEGDGGRTDFPVYRFTTRNTAASGLTNDAVYVGTISLGQADLKVTAASILDDGSAFVIRGVNGGNGKPDLDVEGLWRRREGTTIEDVIAARPTPNCRWSLNSAPDSSSEETIAFDLTGAGGTGYDGFVWTHDVRGAAAPYFRAPRTG
jgi:hypothetical protein